MIQQKFLPFFMVLAIVGLAGLIYVGLRPFRPSARAASGLSLDPDMPTTEDGLVQTDCDANRSEVYLGRKGGVQLPATTDAAGRFSFEKLNRGKSEMSVGGEEDLEHRLELPQGAMFKGRVYGPDGKPCAGAKVWARRRQCEGKVQSEIPGPGFYETSSTSETGADGGFAVGPLTVGSYQLHASHHRFADAPAQSLVISGSEDVDGLVLRLGQGNPLYLRVIASDGKALGGATVSLYQKVSDSRIPNMERFFRDGNTTAAGQITLPGVMAGAYILRVTSTAYPMARRDIVVQGTGPVDLGDIQLDVGRKFTGQVLNDINGQPLAGVAVEIAGPHQQRGALTDGVGRFEILGLGAGPYRLHIIHVPYLGFSKNYAQLLAGGVVIRLRAGAGLRGRITTDQVGKAGGLFLMPLPGQSPKVQGLYMSMDITSGGSFVVHGLPVGKYTAILVVKGYAPTPLPDVVHLIAGQIIKTAAIALACGTHISGWVLMSDGRTPAAGTEVYLMPDDTNNFLPTVHVVADSSGAFELRNVMPGTYILMADLNDHLSTEIQVVVEGETPVSNLLITLPER